MISVKVSRFLAEAFREYQETILSYSDPESPGSLEGFLEGFRFQIMENPEICRESSHYLALAMLGQVKLVGGSPLVAWLSDLENLEWSKAKQYLVATEAGRRICQIFDEESLGQALKIFLLSFNHKHVKLIIDEEGG